MIEATPSAVPDWAKRAVILIVSALNGCHFCMASNTEKLVAQGRGELADAISADPIGASAGDPTIDALFAYTRVLTRDPAGVSQAHVIALQWTPAGATSTSSTSTTSCRTTRTSTG